MHNELKSYLAEQDADIVCLQEATTGIFTKADSDEPLTEIAQEL